MAGLGADDRCVRERGRSFRVLRRPWSISPQRGGTRGPCQLGPLEARLGRRCERETGDGGGSPARPEGGDRWSRSRCRGRHAEGSQPGRGRSGRGESQPCGAVKAAISTGFTLPTGAGSAGLGHRLTQWDMVSGERMAACSRAVAVRGRRMARCACSLEVRVAGHRSGDQPEGSDRLGAWVLAQAPTRSGSVPLQQAASLAGLTHG